MEFRTIDHTADIGIEVTSDTFEGLFEGAALAMMSLLVDPVEVKPRRTMELLVKAGDLEELMFRWLNELLFEIEAHRFLPSEISVERAGESLLSARIKGEDLDPGRHHLKQEIKAATYHGMSIEKNREGWSTRIIFDV